MTTSTRETTLWGTRTSSHQAIPFYGAPGWSGLADGMKWVKEGKTGEDRHIASGHEVLEEMIQAGMATPPFGWITLNSEEVVGLDIEGMIGPKNSAVALFFHGSGLMLNSPQSLQRAYMNKTLKGEPSIPQEEITAALDRRLPDGQKIAFYSLQELMKTDPSRLPRIYTIAVPLAQLESTHSDLVAVDNLPKDDMFVARAGHITTAEKFALMLERAGVEEYRNSHQLVKVDPQKPSGRVLSVGDSINFGLLAYGDLSGSARFVGVHRVMLAGTEGVAP